MEFPILLLFLVFETAVAQVIEEGPRSLNITLGSKARFTCEGRGTILLWTINGIQAAHLINVNRGVETPLTIPTAAGGLLSMVNVSGLRMNDGLRIRCIAISPNTSKFSEVAVLRIQGVLSRVNNLHVSYVGDFSLGVSWDSPYSLQGVPILGYNVTVTDADSGERVYCDTPSDSDVQVPGAVLQACHDYMITVVANNGVGEGNSSSVNVSGYPGVPKVAGVQVSVKVTGVNNRRSISLTAQAIGSCSQQYPTSATVFLRGSLDSPMSETVMANLTFNITSLSSGILEVSADRHYTVDLMLHNKAGSNTSTAVATISTFDVQGLMFGKTTSGLICFACTFLENSKAIGCLIEAFSPRIITMTSNKTLDNSFSTWQCSLLSSNKLYNISVFDIDSDGSVSTMPALLLVSFNVTDAILVTTVPTPTSGPLPTDDSLKLVAVVSSVTSTVVVSMFVLVTLMVVVLWIRHKKHRRDCCREGNGDIQDAIVTNQNPVYGFMAKEWKIETAQNPVYATTGEIAAVSVYETIGHHTGPVYDSVTQFNSVLSPPQKAAAYDTVREVAPPPPLPSREYEDVNDGVLAVKALHPPSSSPLPPSPPPLTSLPTAAESDSEVMAPYVSMSNYYTTHY